MVRSIKNVDGKIYKFDVEAEAEKLWELFMGEYFFTII